MDEGEQTGFENLDTRPTLNVLKYFIGLNLLTTKRNDKRDQITAIPTSQLNYGGCGVNYTMGSRWYARMSRASNTTGIR